ncbi:MAG TPA: antitermination regulator [Lachnospiraceae bacterium]|nr:antitermination regulator [Lachnospiraceae bacterium]
MGNIIVVFPRLEDAKSIKNLLVRHGFSVQYICTTGSQALECMDSLHGGIVISGYKLQDMVYHHLLGEMPPGFEMLLVASGKVIGGGVARGIPSVRMPLRLHELLQAVEAMESRMSRARKKRRQQPRERNPEEQAVIDRAKRLLMEQKHFTEREAHRYLQKHSMDSGNSLAETAGMVLCVMEA